ncbi:hypothetical protein H257_18937 [Aphanomyces astaci]|uniref:Uncharacterized protein n=1 Tax=Aphanomyces astaci TaxID=112090 RepID=W4FBF6_APHAT|nr:hypothetical protein H257_18937 [Aphanomyces astaci]ETV64131.1 hypothetical protein H257_18937 [Aphanomyces astaci]|eukprot:XP_009846386.1 hypothetical protein H257_18937 [Aphanomyces astaci]
MVKQYDLVLALPLPILRQGEDQVVLYNHRPASSVRTPWAKIATSLPGRSVDQVKTQWRRLTSPWTSDDNKKLMHLCTSTTSLQPSWLWIASHFPSRTDLQCRQHWTHVLDPALKKGKGTWTDEDDQLLGISCCAMPQEPWTLDEDSIVLAAVLMDGGNAAHPPPRPLATFEAPICRTPPPPPLEEDVMEGVWRIPHVSSMVNSIRN